MDRSQEPGDGRVNENEKGATLVEYALLTALFVAASLGALTLLTQESEDYLVETGTSISEPREHIADMDDDLPDPPAWVP